MLFRQLNPIFHLSPAKGRVTDLHPGAPHVLPVMPPTTQVQSSLKVIARASSKLPREGCSSPFSALNSLWKRENIFVSYPTSRLPRPLLPTSPTTARCKYPQNPVLQKEQGLWFHRDWDTNITQAKWNWASQHFMVSALSAGRSEMESINSSPQLTGNLTGTSACRAQNTTVTMHLEIWDLLSRAKCLCSAEPCPALNSKENKDHQLSCFLHKRCTRSRSLTVSSEEETSPEKIRQRRRKFGRWNSFVF